MFLRKRHLMGVALLASIQNSSTSIAHVLNQSVRQVRLHHVVVHLRYTAFWKARDVPLACPASSPARSTAC